LNKSVISEAVSPAESDNVFSFRVPGGVDEVLTLKNKNTMKVIMDDNIHKITAQFDILATNLPDLGKSVELDFLWALKLATQRSSGS
jgi:hypothetical protein